jgi:hypothetical protein
MVLKTRKTGLAAIVIATAVAGSIAPGAAASFERMNVNPGSGFATPAPPPGKTVQVNPSTGFESPTAAEASSGFDWASAGIGAATGAGLVLVLVLSAATVGVGGLRRARRVG